MPEFFTLQSPDNALKRFLPAITPLTTHETIPTAQAVGRVLTAALRSPQTLPEFRRSTVDGYAVIAVDTFSASDTLPTYLQWVGEVPMGTLSAITLERGQLATVHTGGGLPEGADAVVMIENTRQVSDEEIEVHRPAAPGENVIQPGEDIEEGETMFEAGHRLRPADSGALMAVGVTNVTVTRQPRVAIFATGDEVIPPHEQPTPGQIRDINSYTVAGLVEQAGAVADIRHILPDDAQAMDAAVRESIAQGADMVVLSAGSSVSVRDVTADVFAGIGEPGVLVHGIATRPGKPTILAVADGLPLIGLPGNPVSAYVQFIMVGIPALARLSGTSAPLLDTLPVKLLTNVASTAGREDYVPAKLVHQDGETWAEPIFFKSNLIFTLSAADGLLRIPLDATGIEAGETAAFIRL